MKGFILFSMLAMASTASSMFDEYSMKPPLVPQKNKRVHFFEIKIGTNPVLEFKKFESKLKMSVNNRFFEYLFIPKGRTFYGIIVRSNLFLTPIMKDSEFATSVLRSFGQVPFQCSEGTVSRRYFLGAGE